VSFLLASFLILQACSLTGPASSPEPAESDRAELIAAWNQCLENYFENDNSNAREQAIQSVTAGMETCQGHRYDIVAAYPHSMAPSINKMLTNAAYRTSYRASYRKETNEPSHPRLEKALRSLRDEQRHRMVNGLLSQ